MECECKMKRLIRISLLALLPLICCAQSQIGDRNFGSSSVPGPVLVSTTFNQNSGSTWSISTTGEGHFVAVVVMGTSQPSSVSIGSQSTTKYITCTTPNVVGMTACLWYIANSTGGQSSASVVGGTSWVAWEYEFSGTNLVSPIDTVGICYWIQPSSGTSNSCNAVVTPSTYHDGVIAVMVNMSGSSISGSPTLLSNQNGCSGGFCTTGTYSGEATLSSLAAETVSATFGGGGYPSDITGAIWAFN